VNNVKTAANKDITNDTHVSSCGLFQECIKVGMQPTRSMAIVNKTAIDGELNTAHRINPTMAPTRQKISIGKIFLIPLPHPRMTTEIVPRHDSDKKIAVEY